MEQVVDPQSAEAEPSQPVIERDPQYPWLALPVGGSLLTLLIINATLPELAELSLWSMTFWVMTFSSVTLWSMSLAVALLICRAVPPRRVFAISFLGSTLIAITASLHLGSLWLDTSSPVFTSTQVALLTTGAFFLVWGLYSWRDHYVKSLRNLTYHMERFQKMSQIDPLTNLHNSRFFRDYIEEAVNYAEQNEENLSLLVIDIDNLEEVNGEYGHLVGDEMLALVGMSLKSKLRSREKAFRLSSEQFAVVIPGENLDDAKHTADSIRKFLSSKTLYRTNEQVLHISVSAGLTDYHPHSTIREFIRKADQALCKAKTFGPNQVCAIH